jgi:hypothetical protein
VAIPDSGTLSVGAINFPTGLQQIGRVENQRDDGPCPFRNRWLYGVFG